MKLWYLIISITVLTSCGTRKRVVALQKLEVKELKEIVLTLQNEITTNVTVTNRANTITLTPIDPTRESIYNGMAFNNTKVSITEKESDSTATIKDLSQSKTVETTDTQIDSKQKDIDLKTEKPNPYLWIGLILVVCFGLWVVVRKGNTVF